MVHYYIRNNTGIGYVVAQLLTGDDFIPGCSSCNNIRNFGYRQSDAIEFRNDLRKGLIPESRIKQLVKSYTEQPYRYLGNGNLRKLRMVEQELPFKD